MGYVPLISAYREIRGPLYPTIIIQIQRLLCVFAPGVSD